MANLTSKQTVTTYDLTGLTEEELLMIFQLVSRVCGNEKDTYRNICANLRNLIQQETKWTLMNNPRMLIGYLEAIERNKNGSNII